MLSSAGTPNIAAAEVAASIQGSGQGKKYKSHRLALSGPEKLLIWRSSDLELGLDVSHGMARLAACLAEFALHAKDRIETSKSS